MVHGTASFHSFGDLVQDTAIVPPHITILTAFQNEPASDMEKQKLASAHCNSFRDRAPGQAFRAKGFYDYGRNASTLRIDKVSYNFAISSDGVITGTSNDIAGSATISGLVDFKTKKVWFTKKYGLTNLCATWIYDGRLTADASRIAGFWSGTQDYQERFASPGRFGLWVANPSVDAEEATLRLLLQMCSTHDNAVATDPDEALSSEEVDPLVGSKIPGRPTTSAKSKTEDMDRL